jgi:FlaA1/EpsC-like NDP-sugar epimerase
VAKNRSCLRKTDLVLLQGGFGFMDCLLILTGILMGIYFRFWGYGGFIYFLNRIAVLKMMLIIIVIQVSYYYFNLYDAKTLKNRIRVGILLIGSLGASSIVLAVTYYLIPSLTMGRGIFAISLFLVLVFTFIWRVVYSYILKEWVPKERILIIGTGELAKKIKSEILENGQEGLEIVGFIDEDRDKIGRSI